MLIKDVECLNGIAQHLVHIFSTNLGKLESILVDAKHSHNGSIRYTRSPAVNFQSLPFGIVILSRKILKSETMPTEINWITA